MTVEDVRTLVQQDYQEVLKNQAKFDVAMAKNDKNTLLKKWNYFKVVL